MKRQHHKKELTEIQSLRKENQALKKENSRLRKQMDRSKHYYEDAKIFLEAEQEVLRDEVLHSKEPRLAICDNCFRRGLEEITIINRTFKRCQICDWRSKAIITND